MSKDLELIGRDVNLGNKAVMLLNQDRPAEAETILRDVLSRHPQSALVRYTLGLTLLKQGRLGEAWEHYAHRLNLPNGPKVPLWGAKLWQGEDLNGKTLAVIWEQGYGDMWQFIRYAPKIKAKYPDCKIWVLCRHGMKSMLEPMGCFDIVTEDGQSVGDGFEIHYVCPVVDLAAGVGIRSPKDIRGHAYLKRPEQMDLGPRGNIRVGLCWAGNPEHRKDSWRTPPFSVWRPLLGVSGVEFFSVGCKPRDPFRPIPMTPDWKDTAAGLVALDLLITVDTGTAHFAGALGVRTWTLIHFGGDFRWFLNDRRTPWYDSMRLYRQGHDRDWAPTIEWIAKDLEGLVSRTGGNVQPLLNG